MRLRFCFVTTFYPPCNFGGDGVGIERLAQALVGRGHEVTVVHDADAYDVLKPGAMPEPARDPAGVRVVTLRSRVPRLATLLTHQLGRPVVHGRELRAILVPDRFDVVVFNNVSLVGGPGVLSYGGPRAVTMYLAHEHWLVCPTHVLWRHQTEPCDGRECIRCQLSYRRPPQWWRYTKLLERGLADVDVFVAMSEFSRRKHREFGFPRDMEVLPYFLPEVGASGTLPAPHARPYFLFVGRLESLKGLQDVIPLVDESLGADLLVAGDGTFEPELRRRAQGNPHVRFLGRVQPDALDALYRHALALVVPSLGFETFGIVLIEAFRHGLPAIARRRGPFPEIVDRSGGGLLFDTPGEARGAMRRMIEAPAERAAMGRAARAAFLAHWTEGAVVPQFLAIVDRAAAERRSRRGPRSLPVCFGAAS